MKGCILEANLEGQGLQSILLTILLKEGGVLQVVLPGKGAND